MRENSTRFPLSGWLWQMFLAGLLAVAVVCACWLAPTEVTMGHAQRIVYLHVPVAWLGLLGFLVMAACGVIYLVGRNLLWDHWFQAAGETGWLCTSLTLVTGSLWAHEAWGTWWVWDPRLTAAFVMWCMFCGILMVRSGLEDPHRRARVGAVLAILGALDVPLVVMATRWFRGLHPVAPEMDPMMRMALLTCVVAFTVLFAWLVNYRRRQVALEQLTIRLESQADMERS
jgi:heme exporter protein C